MGAKRCIIPLPRTKRARALLCALLAAALLLLLGVLLLGQREPALPPESAALRSAAEGLTGYDLTLRLDPEAGVLTCSQRVDFRNCTGDSLDTLTLRVYLNAFASEETSPAALEEIYDACYPGGFSPGYMELFDVTWQGEAASWRYADTAKTVLEIDVPAIAPGDGGALFLRWAAHIPACAHRTGYADGVWQLGNVVPLLSLYRDGAWRQDEYSPIGDPFVSECADFQVRLVLPDGYVPACTAFLSETAAGVWEGRALASRDFALCVSDRYETARAVAGDTLVSAYAFDKAGARRALDAAKKALETFEGLYGDYPWPAFSVCPVDFPFGGMEYPGLVMLAKGYFAADQRDSMELVLAHETAHQWFYALVGSDQVNDPWQDEALCEWAMLRYVRENYGQGSFDTLRHYRIDLPMQENIPGSLTPGSPIDYFGALADYSAVVYGRGAALLLALDEMLPGGADAFLRAYAEEFAFRFVTRAEFEAYLNGYAQMDLSPLATDYLDTIM